LSSFGHIAANNAEDEYVGAHPLSGREFELEVYRNNPREDRVFCHSDLGEVSLRDVKHQHVQQMCLGLLQKTYTVGKDHKRNVRKDPETGGPRFVLEKRARQVQYSVQTALHLKNATSAVFEYAKAVGMYSGGNPARYVRLPEMQRKGKHSLTIEQMALVLGTIPSPAREMSHVVALTSMNFAEICGLLWKFVNLTRQWVIVDGEAIPPMAIAVRRQWSTRMGGGAYHSLKRGTRRRNPPIDSELERILRGVAARDKFTGHDDPVFVSTTGKPVDSHNLFNRVLKPIGTKLGMPWLGWHV
jgi:integrase